MRRTVQAAVAVLLALHVAGAASLAADHQPPVLSAGLLSAVDFSKATALAPDYRRQFVRCDGLASGGAGKDTFRGVGLTGHYRCSTDPSRVKVLLKLADGGVYWESKMALDLDGSWASWSGEKWKTADGKPLVTTDLCGTSMKWKSYSGSDCQHPEAQVDSDRFPFVVMPTASLTGVFGQVSKGLGAEFGTTTSLKMRDMGVVIYKDRWSPVFIADGGPFMRLGEGSARLFENLGESRCKKWDEHVKRCVGPGAPVYPYKNYGVGKNVIFILYPGSGKASMTPENAITEICAYAKTKLGLTGGAACPN